jgi:hypothetical protein
LCYSTNKLLQKQKAIKITLTIPPADRVFGGNSIATPGYKKYDLHLVDHAPLFVPVMALSMLRQTASSARIISTKEIAFCY